MKNLVNELMSVYNEASSLRSQLDQKIENKPFIIVNSVDKIENKKLIGELFEVVDIEFDTHNNTVMVITKSNYMFNINNVTFMSADEIDIREENKVVCLDTFRETRIVEKPQDLLVDFEEKLKNC